jgi:hypothetical protein
VFAAVGGMTRDAAAAAAFGDDRVKAWFLANEAAEATRAGVEMLRGRAGLDAQELCIFYRHGHFFVLLKWQAAEGAPEVASRLCLLETAEANALPQEGAPQGITWQELTPHLEEVPLDERFQPLRQEWSCTACTLENAAASAACEACGTPRRGGGAVPRQGGGGGGGGGGSGGGRAGGGGENQRRGAQGNKGGGCQVC